MMGSPWQPIASAPLDETIIDLWAGTARYPECWWSGEQWVSYQDGHYDHPTVKHLFVIDEPSHWMPMPDAPDTLKDKHNE